jgi:glycosyltransferase involved in cell wall biosynthesis
VHGAGPRFLFLGRPEERKGIAVLLEAFARMQTTADLMLVGGDWDSPGLPQQLRARAGQLGVKDRVFFENHRPDVGALLDDCDVFVLPSLCDTRPRAIIEAMHKQRPVISTRVCGIPTLVEDGVSGILVPPSDVPALTAALDRLARSETLRNRLGRAARERARRELSLEQTIKNYLSVYNSLVSPKSAAHAAH